MWRLILPIVYLAVCSGAIGTYVTSDSSGVRPEFIENYPFISFVGLLLLSQIVTVVDLSVRHKRIEVVSAVYFGLLIGFLLTYQLLQALNPLIRGTEAETLVSLFASLLLPYICVSLLIQTRDDFRFVIPYVEFSREIKGGRAVILDSSSLIDGRVADVIDTNILEADLLVPQFVLHEVQEIADSGDKMRRGRGRRGLEVLSKLQNNPRVDVQVVQVPENDLRGLSVDQRLVELALRRQARIMTNDYNLNRVASVQGVDVINLNDVGNSLKPRFIPGERLEIKIMREGESPGQGVGYLDDGTMVVCEHASHLLGKSISVVVTSVLQSSAGRMIFGRQAGTDSPTNSKS